MKNKKVLTIIGVTAIAANLGLATLVGAQGTTEGEVQVGCFAGSATANFSSLPNTINFEQQSYGIGGKRNMTNSNPFAITVIDNRGYDEGTEATDTCGPGWNLTIVADQANFDKNGSSDTQMSSSAIEIQQTGWNSTGGGARITAESGALTGVNTSNIIGSTDNININNTTPQTILSANEAFGGTVALTFAAESDDINVTLPTLLELGTYTLPMTLTFNAS